MSVTAASVPVDLLAALQDAALGVVGWSEALDRLRAWLDVEVASHISFNLTLRRPDFTAFGAILPQSEAAARAYNEHWGAQDVHLWSQLRPQAQVRIPDGRPFPDYAYISEKEIEKNPYMQEFFIPIGLRHMMTTIVERRPDRMTTFSALRGVDRSPFDDSDLARFDALGPHLMRINLLRQRLSEAVLSESLARGALDRLGFPLMICKPDGGLLMANATAVAALEDGRLLRQAGSRVVPSDGKLRETWLRQLQAAADPRTLILPQRLTDPDGRPHLALMQSVAASAANGAFVLDMRYVLVILLDAAAGAAPPGRVLSELYRLSPTEAQVALLVADGLSADEIAARHAVKPETVRTQIKSVMRKMDVRRQTGIVAAISRLNLPVTGRSGGTP